jgi:cobalt/nickel transport protein
MCSIALAAPLVLLLCAPVRAHFVALIPSSDVVEQGGPQTITLDISFTHPFEGRMMQMDRPRALGVSVREMREDLAPSLHERREGGLSAWETPYRVRRPGDQMFWVEPEPYFEQAEGKFIVHYAKVVVGALGLEQGWQGPLGLPLEILPLSRPYGLWAGNVFQGVVLMGGKPLPGAAVEVEYMNTGGRVRAPSSPFVTQVVRADERGVFTYAMPREGWWGFAALADAPYTIKRGGRPYPVELGGVIWVRARQMR